MLALLLSVWLFPSTLWSVFSGSHLYPCFRDSHAQACILQDFVFIDLQCTSPDSLVLGKGTSVWTSLSLFNSLFSASDWKLCESLVASESWVLGTE